jgi:hypothetical protein
MPSAIGHTVLVSKRIGDSWSDVVDTRFQFLIDIFLRCLGAMLDLPQEGLPLGSHLGSNKLSNGAFSSFDHRNKRVMVDRLNFIL